MINIIRSEERGKANHGWLKSFHSFSFADYYNPQMMGFRNLRVINEDWIEPGQGFPMHPHANMEILTYVIEGTIAHKDSMGNVKTVPAGEVQAMSAGTGVRHSEYNPSESHPLHLLQIWIVPNKKDIQPKYSEWKPKSPNLEGLNLFASPTGENESVQIQQDCKVYYGEFKNPFQQKYGLEKGRAVWIQMIGGSLTISGDTLNCGDAASIQDHQEIQFSTENGTKFLLFDLA